MKKLRTLIHDRQTDEIYCSNVKDIIRYPDSEGNIISVNIMGHWYDKQTGKYMYKLNPGFLIVDEAKLALYNEITW
jgi:hypothetical protein